MYITVKRSVYEKLVNEAMQTHDTVYNVIRRKLGLPPAKRSRSFEKTRVNGDYVTIHLYTHNENRAEKKRRGITPAKLLTC